MTWAGRRRGGRLLRGAPLLLALLALPGCSKAEPALPTREVRQFLQAWSTFDLPAMADLVAVPPEEVGAAVTGMKEALQVTAARFTTGKVEFGDSRSTATAHFGASLELAGLGTWEYQNTLGLVRAGDAWRIEWSPAVMHPALDAPGLRFERTREWPVRAPILGAGGAELASMQEVTVVGLAPGRIRDRTQVDAVLKQQLGVEPAEITAALTAPGVQPEHFVAIRPVRTDRFAALRPVLEPVPGVFFQRGHARLSPADGFAGHVIGRVEEITAERLAQLKAPYVVGDKVGLSGLEAVYERELAGLPRGEVRVVGPQGAPPRPVFTFPGRAPQPVRITLDTAVQRAAEEALAGVTQPAALVAVDVATGDVRAVASRPLTEEFNRGLDGRYPPGSTFKVVTAAALLGAGTTAAAPVPCPPEATVGGQKFVNFEGEALGATSFRNAFAHSCNTAIVSLVAGLPAEDLSAAADAFGFGRSYPDFSIPVAGGQFPAPRDAAEKASAAIGQGRVVASPVHMASVAAAVAAGAWRPPRLLADHPPGTSGPGLSPGTAAALQDLMGEVVRTGTGTAAAVAGQNVAGKTGTAEIGGPNPDQTHAWFIGFRGGVAFAVLVERGGVGGRVAAPIAAKFLAALGR